MLGRKVRGWVDVALLTPNAGKPHSQSYREALLVHESPTDHPFHSQWRNLPSSSPSVTQLSLPYHCSAIMASAFDMAILLYRTEHSPTTLPSLPHNAGKKDEGVSRWGFVTPNAGKPHSQSYRETLLVHERSNNLSDSCA